MSRFFSDTGGAVVAAPPIAFVLFGLGAIWTCTAAPSLPGAACLWLLCVAMATDLLWRRIPNALTLPTVFFGVIYNASPAPGAIGPAAALTGILVGGALLLVLYRMGGVGGGDVKLLAALGAWLGPEAVTGLFVYGALAGALYAAFLLWRGRPGRGRRNAALENGIPYSLPLALGFVLWSLRGVPW